MHGNEYNEPKLHVAALKTNIREKGSIGDRTLFTLYLIRLISLPSTTTVPSSFRSQRIVLKIRNSMEQS